MLKKIDEISQNHTNIIYIYIYKREREVNHLKLYLQFGAILLLELPLYGNPKSSSSRQSRKEFAISLREGDTLIKATLTNLLI